MPMPNWNNNTEKPGHSRSNLSLRESSDLKHVKTKRYRWNIRKLGQLAWITIACLHTSFTFLSKSSNIVGFLTFVSTML